MTMFSTKYPNNVRTVSGLNVAVFNTDVVLAVNTSSSACSINLEQIPDNYWNTTWKLYIYDSSNNASVNNITINAGAGQTINGSSSVIISNNNGGYLVRVLSNNQFIGTASGGSSAISLTTIGTSGASTLIGNVLNVPNYSTGIITLTNAAMLSLINANTVVVGQLYRITDAIINTGDLGVIVTGTTTNSVSSDGTGLFYNADYQGLGDYTGTAPTYSGTNLGIWYSTYAGAIAIGDVVIWNNLNYINLTGVWGTTPSVDTTNWLGLLRSGTTGYILAADFVNYNVKGNYILYRADNLGNQVTLGFKIGNFNTLQDFQWGRSRCTQNVVIGVSNLKGMINSNAKFIYNVFQSAQVVDNTIPTFAGDYTSNYFLDCAISVNQNSGNINSNNISKGNLVIGDIGRNGTFSGNQINSLSVCSIDTIGSFSSFNYNVLSNKSSVNIVTIAGSSILEACNFKDGGILGITTIAGGINIYGCESSDGNTVTLGTVTSNLTNFIIRKGYSNWEETLNAPDCVVGTTITIPASSNFVGVFTVKNIGGGTLDTVVNMPTNHSIILKPDVVTASTFRIVPIAIGVAIAGNILETSSSSTGGQTYTGRTNGCDEAILNKYGNLVGLTNKNIWL